MLQWPINCRCKVAVLVQTPARNPKQVSTQKCTELFRVLSCATIIGIKLRRGEEKVFALFWSDSFFSVLILLKLH